MSTVTDPFTRANETPLAAPWAASVDPAWDLISNAATPNSTGSDSSAIYNGAGAPTWGNDQSIKGKITVSATGTGDGIGFWLRHAAGATKTGYRFITCHDASNNCELAKFVTGTFTLIQDWTQAFTNGDEWEFRAVGSTLTFYVNGSLVKTITDSSVASGSPGLASSSPITSGSIDDVTMTDTPGGTDATVTAVPALSLGDVPPPAVAAQPVNTVDPVISGGDDSTHCHAGQTLTCSTGTWTGSPSFAYQWNAVNVTPPFNHPVGTGSTYVVGANGALTGDLITCDVTATNAAGSTPKAASNVLTVTSSPDATVSAVPAVSLGDVPPPAVASGTNATVTAVPALSAGDVPVPAVSAGATVAAVAALSLGSAPPTNQILSAVVSAPASVAAGSVPPPTVSSAGNATVSAVPALSAGDVPVPSLAAGSVVAAVAAVSAGDVPAPAFAAGWTVTAVPALSVGQAPRPAITPAPPGGGGTALVSATFAEDAA